jgi:hypothetical protein
MKAVIYNLVVIGLMSMMTSACTNSISERQLLGKYYYNDNSLDSIILYRDHTYQHKFSTNRMQNGLWSYDSIGSEIKFDDFIFFDDDGLPLGPGLWYSRVKYKSNSIVLVYSDDNYQYYVRCDE